MAGKGDTPAERVNGLEDRPDRSQGRHVGAGHRTRLARHDGIAVRCRDRKGQEVV